MARLSYKRKINQIRKTLLREKIPFKKIILFGSYAKGFATKNSDMDLCLIFADKEKKDLENFRSRSSIALYKFEISLDIIVTTMTEFKKNKVSPILHEIRTSGIVV